MTTRGHVCHYTHDRDFCNAPSAVATMVGRVDNNQMLSNDQPEDSGFELNGPTNYITGK